MKNSEKNLSFGFEDTFRKKKRMYGNSKNQIILETADGKGKTNSRNPDKNALDLVAQPSFLNSISKNSNKDESDSMYIKENITMNSNHRIQLSGLQKNG